MRRRATAVLGGAALALAVVVAAHAASVATVIGRGAQLKGSRIWYAQGKAAVPKAISARVVPTPVQPVKVQWSVVCQKPNRYDPAMKLAPSGKSGVSSVRAAATVELALPYAKPPSCVATVYATLARDGKLTLRLLQS